MRVWSSFYVPYLKRLGNAVLTNPFPWQTRVRQSDLISRKQDLLLKFQTLNLWSGDFQRGSEIRQSIWKTKGQNPGSVQRNRHDWQAGRSELDTQPFILIPAALELWPNQDQTMRAGTIDPGLQKNRVGTLGSNRKHQKNWVGTLGSNRKL